MAVGVGVTLIAGADARPCRATGSRRWPRCATSRSTAPAPRSRAPCSARWSPAVGVALRRRPRRRRRLGACRSSASARCSLFVGVVRARPGRRPAGRRRARHPGPRLRRHVRHARPAQRDAQPAAHRRHRLGADDRHRRRRAVHHVRGLDQARSLDDLIANAYEGDLVVDCRTVRRRRPEPRPGAGDRRACPRSRPPTGLTFATFTVNGVTADEPFAIDPAAVDESSTSTSSPARCARWMRRASPCSESVRQGPAAGRSARRSRSVRRRRRRRTCTSLRSTRTPTSSAT